MASTVAASAPIPDLSKPQSFVDAVPHAAFAELRRRPGLYWQPTKVSTVHGGYWAVTRFADIVAIEKNLAAFTSTHGAAYPLLSPAPIEGPMADGLMMNDPPRHSRLRRVAAAGFSPRVVANFESWIREIVRDAIEDVADKNEFDYVDAFARTVPAYVIGRVLGARREDRQRLVDWTIALFLATQQSEHPDDDGDTRIANVVAAQQRIGAYAEEIQAFKRKEPADDMFTALNGSVERGEITQAEFVRWMILMMSAGFETTHTVIGQSMRMYLEDPEVCAATDRAVQEGLSGRVADEYIRLVTPAMQMARTAKCDVEVAGTKVCKGDVMVLYYVSANRDESIYSNPDKFDPWRKETDTLAFGSGIHRCLGSHLAKLEVQILFEELHKSGYKLRLNGQPKRGWSNFINQLNELPVAKG